MRDSVEKYDKWSIRIDKYNIRFVDEMFKNRKFLGIDISDWSKYKHNVTIDKIKVLNWITELSDKELLNSINISNFCIIDKIEGKKYYYTRGHISERHSWRLDKIKYITKK